MHTDVSRYEAGLSRMRAIFGPGAEAELKRLAETSPDLVKMWNEKKAMTSSAPTPFFLIYKDTLIDGQGQVLVKEGTASNEVPSSSTP